MKTINIYGAGMAGLLAGNVFRHHHPKLHERASELPDNHGALLRFRTDIVAQVTGLPFRRVRVLKAVKGCDGLRNHSTLRDSNLYSFKVTGSVMTRSVLDLSPCDRYIAPPTFLDALARQCDITFDDSLDLDKVLQHRDNGDAVISTIPMPVLMSVLDYQPRPDFRWLPIWSTTIRVDTPMNVYQTIYYPNPDDGSAYRASITGNEVIIEAVADDLKSDGELVAEVMNDFGIPYNEWCIVAKKRQEFGKLLPIDEDSRQRFILHATDQFGIYSVGRFATWRQILLDDVVDDIRKVERWIAHRNNYSRRVEV